jgi:hypothetical protein
MAFATQVIVGAADLDACPYLDSETLEPFRERLQKQHGAGIGLKREGFEKALEHLRSEIRKCDFESLAPSLGAELVEEKGKPALRFKYFGEAVLVDGGDILYVSGESPDPWEKILLYIYVIGGAAEPSGEWVGMESLPNSVSKIKSLKAHCEDRLARECAGRLDRLPAAVEPYGRILPLSEGEADFAAEFPVLPKFSVRIYWWDEDAAEGFEPGAKFVFDSRIDRTLDLESLLFACEKLTDRILAAFA